MLLFAFALACAPKTQPEPMSAPEGRVAAPRNSPSGANLPTPYTAEQLRAAFPEGTVLTLRVTVPGGPPVLQEWVFKAPDDTQVTVASRVLAEDGTVMQDEGEKRTPWTELRDHASFPAAATTRANGTVTVPAGTFQTWHYDVQDVGEGGVAVLKRFDFATEVPGPPVKMVVESGGMVVMTMELVSRTQK